MYVFGNRCRTLLFAIWGLAGCGQGPTTPPNDAGGDSSPPRHCTPNAYVGDTSWTRTIEVKATTVYCSSNSDFYDLKGNRARKVKLAIPAGKYSLPDRPGRAAFALPACVSDDETTGVPGATGEISYVTETLGGDVSHRYTLLQPLSDGRHLVLGFTRVVRGNAAVSFSLDGSLKDFGSEYFFYSNLCQQGGDANCSADATFTSCTMADVASGFEKVTFEGGNIEFEMRHAAPPGLGTQGTDASVVLSATGVLRGSSFAQKKFFSLLYAPGRHHLIRSYAVFFDDPIGGACGIELDKMQFLEKLVAKNAYTIDCSLNRLNPLKVLSATHVGAF